jgi:hypothetical protein
MTVDADALIENSASTTIKYFILISIELFTIYVFT